MKTFMIVTVAMLVITLTFVWTLGAKELTPEQKAEDKTVLYMVKDINKQVPLDTLVTKKTIQAIKEKIASVIIKAGYSKKEFYIKFTFCPRGHIHYLITIISKTQNGRYEGNFQYYFKKTREYETL